MHWWPRPPSKHQPILLDGRPVPYMDYSMPWLLPWSACGNPVLAVPAGTSVEGLPIGVQIGAPHYAEDGLIHFGKEVERLGFGFVPPPAQASIP